MGNSPQIVKIPSTTDVEYLVNFSQWAGLILCQICGALLNDRVPLWISRRRGGAWHLEYRLYPILLVAAASPIGFGIFGAGIQYAITTLPADTQTPSWYVKISSALYGSSSRHISRHLRRMLQYPHICELYHRMFQDLAARGRRNYECLSTNFGPCLTILPLSLAGCRECWLVGVWVLSKRLEAKTLIDETGFLGWWRFSVSSRRCCYVWWSGKGQLYDVGTWRKILPRMESRSSARIGLRIHRSKINYRMIFLKQRSSSDVDGNYESSFRAGGEDGFSRKINLATKHLCIRGIRHNRNLTWVAPQEL